MTNLLIFVKERENLIIKDQSVKQGEIPYIILNSLEKVLFFNYFSFSYSTILLVFVILILVQRFIFLTFQSLSWRDKRKGHLKTLKERASWQMTTF